MLRISFDFGHPAHYLMFRDELSKNEALGFKPVIFIHEKDVLTNLTSTLSGLTISSMMG